MQLVVLKEAVPNAAGRRKLRTIQLVVGHSMQLEVKREALPNAAGALSAASGLQKTTLFYSSRSGFSKPGLASSESCTKKPRVEVHSPEGQHQQCSGEIGKDSRKKSR